VGGPIGEELQCPPVVTRPGTADPASVGDRFGFGLGTQQVVDQSANRGHVIRRPGADGGRFRTAEPTQDGATDSVDHDMGRFDPAVDDTHGVEVGNRGGDRGEKAGSHRYRRPGGLEGVGSRPSEFQPSLRRVEQLHHSGVSGLVQAAHLALEALDAGVVESDLDHDGTVLSFYRSGLNMLRHTESV